MRCHKTHERASVVTLLRLIFSFVEHTPCSNKDVSKCPPFHKLAQSSSHPTRLTLRQFLHTQLPDLIYRRRLTLDGALRRLHGPTNGTPGRKDIRRQLRLDSDDPDAWIVGPAVVHAIPQVTQPGLQRWRVVLVHDLGLREDGGGAGYGGPGAGDGVEEGHVGLLRVDGQVHGLAGEEVRVEDEVDAAVFLVWVFVC